MTPRRSSRARTTQPPNGPQHTHSSSSSTSSGRLERSTRSNNKASSPHKSVTPRSLSSEDLEDDARDTQNEPLQSRRRRRHEDGSDPIKSSNAQARPTANDEEEEEEGEEITRCVCGQLEYPGPPSKIGAETKTGIKDGGEQLPSAIPAEALPDESGGLFIQCDVCKVWQHGGCVGIMEVNMSPDEYFCEQCRRNLHKISVGPTGQKYSRYLPVTEPASPNPSRSTSHSKDAEFKSPAGRSSRPTTGGLGGKRRSTMNSRDAAYDEEEQLRIAIEKSKAGGTSTDDLETSSRKVKRGRSESEEIKPSSSKRQRTTSGSPTISQSNSHSTSHLADSDEEEGSNKNNTTAGGRRIRGAAARNHRDKELRDRERDKEKDKVEAVGRRKGRAERRRGDDAELVDDVPSSESAFTKPAASTSQDPPSSSQPQPGTPPPNIQASTSTPSNRKTGRPPARRGRVGRNQYTKDRDPPDQSARDRDISLNRSQSRDGFASEETTNGVNGMQNHHGTNGETAKVNKQKYTHPQRTTMNEMKRRVSAILEFISKTQVEMAGERTPPSAAAGAATSMVKNLAETLPGFSINGTSNGSEKSNSTDTPEKPFNELSSLEMMDVLTRRLVLWQKDYGKWGEK
ncbi:MAG: hypothetical protein M1837_005072 [Sclerophora amabilis]|nr:MAG: hypothetical protein M1837_005072 [Sclerophora amabilis]